MSVVVACLQCASRFGDVEHNMKLGEELCRRAVSQRDNVKFIVFPETFFSGYLSQDLQTNWHAPNNKLDTSQSPYPKSQNPMDVAQKQGGPLVTRFGEIANELKVYITIPLLELCDEIKDDSELKFYNAVSLVGPDGQVKAHYRKNNPWRGPEKYWATAGDELATFQTEYGKIGIAVCFDIHSILLRYSREKIWLLLYPIGWVGNTDFWYGEELPKRLELCKVPFYVTGANWSVEEYHQWIGMGYSHSYAPHGKIIASTTSRIGNEIIYAEVPVETPEFQSSYQVMDETLYQKWDWITTIRPEAPIAEVNQPPQSSAESEATCALL
jgi:predicted amidohydrolase